MGLFGFGKKQSSECQAAGCSHPISHQITLYEEPGNARKATGVKCTQCGEALTATLR